jgi:hypothetical protein
LNKKDKDFESTYIDFIKNIGIFKSMNNIYKKNDSISKKKNEMNQEKYRFNYLKKVYIQYILKYSNMIKNNINKKREEFDIQFSKDLISKEIQTDIYKYYDIFDKFLHEDVSKFFSNVIFDYSSKDIDSIFATDILYDYKFEKIKKYSDFNFNDASNVMLYIIVSQLNKIIIFKGADDALKKDELINYEDDDDDLIKKMDTMKSNMKTIRSKYICEFILLIFHLIDEDNEIFEKCENETEKIKNSFIHDIIQQRSKLMSQDEDTDYFSKMLSKMSSRPSQQSTNEFDEKVNNDQKEINDNIELEEESSRSDSEQAKLAKEIEIKIKEPKTNQTKLCGPLPSKYTNAYSNVFKYILSLLKSFKLEKFNLINLFKSSLRLLNLSINIICCSNASSTSEK